MFLIQNLSSLRLHHVFSVKAERVLQSVRESFMRSSCQSRGLEQCRDESAAFVLKFVAMASILMAGLAGIAIPLAGKPLRADGDVFVAAARAFAAGVILATGFVHMLRDSWDALGDPCLGTRGAWAKFPFTGFFAMLSALLTLLFHVLATQYYCRREEERARVKLRNALHDDLGCNESLLETGIVEINDVGIGNVVERRGHSHSHHRDDVESTVRHVVVSQVLELGIVSHSMIIGLSLGVSESPCSMKPLIVALSFHQFFEGFALGGCISQAQFKTLSATIMSCFFALTAPLGVAVGTSIASIFNPHSPGALITEGILDALSAGILVYMALVDLIAVDFLNNKMSSNFRLNIICCCLLFLGAGSMSSLAIWA